MSGGTRSYEMARRMVAAGHDVYMVTSFRGDGKKPKEWFITNEAGIEVHWFPVSYSNDMSYLQRILAFMSFAKAARKKAIALDGDVVFATSTPLTIALPAVPAARKKRIPMVFEVRDLWPEMPIAMGALNNPVLRFLAHKLERWAYRNSSAVVALSPGMKEGVVRTGFPAEKIAVIPNSSDNTEFDYCPKSAAEFRANRSWLKNYPLLVYTGTFGKVNGVSYMVELAKELLDINSNIRILLVGKGAELEATLAYAIESGVYEKNLFIEKPLPKKDIPTLLSAATMCSNLVIDLPEARANSANKFFDSLAAGKPVLLNHGGWMNKLVSLHNCGLSAWEKPISTVAEELSDKMNDSVWLEKAGFNAKRLALNEFDRDKLAIQLEQVLDAAVTNKSDLASTIAPGEYNA